MRVYSDQSLARETFSAQSPGKSSGGAGEQTHGHVAWSQENTASMAACNGYAALVVEVSSIFEFIGKFIALS